MAGEWGTTPVPRWADDAVTAGRQARARATRRALLLAAATLVDGRGYHGASLNDVAAVAGTTKGAVYFHFPSKSAIAEALFDEVCASWDQLVSDIQARGDDPLRTLLVCYDAYTGVLMHDAASRASARIVRETELVTSRRWVPRWEKVVAGLLHEAGVSGILRPEVDPAWLSRHLTATATGHFQLANSQPGSATMWERMNDTWAGLLPPIASPEWVAAWRRSGWSDRPVPVAADYTRSGLVRDRPDDPTASVTPPADPPADRAAGRR